MTLPYWLQIMAATGGAMIIIYGSIFKRPRDWIKSKHVILKDFLTCSMCIGFWTGVITSYILNDTLTLYIMIGLTSSATSWLYDSVIGCAQSMDVHYNDSNK